MSNLPAGVPHNAILQGRTEAGPLKRLRCVVRLLVLLLWLKPCHVHVANAPASASHHAILQGCA